MGEIKTPIPVVLLLAATSRYPAALAWARKQAEANWGPPQLQSETFVFDQTQLLPPVDGGRSAKAVLCLPRTGRPRPDGGFED